MEVIMDVKEKYSNLLKKKENLQEELTRVDTEYKMSVKECKRLIDEVKSMGYNDVEHANARVKELREQINDCLTRLEELFEGEDEENETVF